MAKLTGWYNNLDRATQFGLKVTALSALVMFVMVVATWLLGPTAGGIALFLALVFFVARAWHRDWMS